MLNRKTIDTDLCVIGGGMAGISAAVAAAREGVRVVLMQERPVLGGNASSEIRMWICGAQGDNMRETGLMEEIFLKNFRYNPTKNPYIFDRILLETVTKEENITLLLNCTCMDAKTETGEFANGRNVSIQSVTGYQMTTQCFYDIRAKFFADCSGDSILAPLTGAEYRIGRESCKEYGEKTHVEESDRLTMGNSCLIQLRETEREIPCVPTAGVTALDENDFSHRNPNLYDDMENFWYLELGGNRDTIEDSEEIAEQLKDLAFGTWNYLKGHPKYRAEKFDLEFMGSLPGKRESRRYVGEYVMKQQDISDAVHFEDTVAYGGWPIDDHFPDGFYHKGRPNTDLRTAAPYPIPYRILYSSNVDNLFFAGRNISATHTALSSLRVMATCSVMGQAVGTAAAVAVRNGLSPHGVYTDRMKEVQKILLDNDCFLPFFKREISALCRNTAIIGGTDALKDGEDRKNVIYGNKECGQSVPNGTELTYRFSQAEAVDSVHFVFNSDLDRSTLPGESGEKMHATRCNILRSSPDIYMPKTLCREFALELQLADGTTEKHTVSDNTERAYHIEVRKPVTKISLTPISNWGDSEATDVFSFDFN